MRHELPAVKDGFMKYPRTQHLVGSRLQHGDFDLSQVPLSDLSGHYVVVEEKVDGANAGISFTDDGALQLQSRGHVLMGGPRERHFALFKTWASCHQATLYEILGTRYILFGEWLYAKHTVFYDALSHYFLEFDVFDKEQGIFLSTAARRTLLDGSPIISVPVLAEGLYEDLKPMTDYVARSRFKSAGWETALEVVATETGQDPELVAQQTDTSSLMEGIYLKIETETETTGRLKWVRHDFNNAILDSGSHWLDRPITPNQLAADVDIYGS